MNPKVGDLRVWRIINMLNEDTIFPVESVKQARELINALAEYELKLERIECSVFGLEVWDGSEWVEWYCRDCNWDVDECKCKEPVWEGA